MAVKSRKARSTSPTVRRVFILFRRNTLDAKKLAQELMRWLGQKGLKAHAQEEHRMQGGKGSSTPAALKEADLVVVLGGDGTYLEAVRLLDGRRTPILGVNLGSLGFLTETRVADLYSALELALASKLEKRPRAMLTCEVRRKSKMLSQFTALNDVVLERGPYSHLINLSIMSDHLPVCDVKADGVIIATPTGSTAYNLAAGGPILHPAVKALVLTPICPHSLTNRPILFPDHIALHLRLKRGRQKAVMTVDGVRRAVLTDRDELVLKRAECEHLVLREPSHNYFQLLREKLKFGERA